VLRKHSRARLLLLSTAVLTAGSAVGAFGARAQIPLPTDSTTTTTAPNSSTTTTTPPLTTPTTSRPPGSSTTTTTAPPSPGTTSPPGTPGTTAPGPTPSGPAPGSDPTGPFDAGTDTAPADLSGIPPAYLALSNGVKRSPPNGTQKLLDALAPLQDLGFTAEEAIAQGFGRFPVAGVTTFTDDWWYPRSNAPFHLHQGTDLFAPMGTPVRAPADGVLTHGEGGLGGLAAYVTQADGTYFYMAHLSSFVAGQVDGQPVHVGDIVGYVGNTGDAAGGPTHVHFEVHTAPSNDPYLYPPPAPPTTVVTKDKKGRKVTVTKPAPAPAPVIVGDLHDPALYGRGALPAFDPKPFLDQWLADALANVPAVIAKAQAGRPQAILATGLLRRFTEGGSGFSAPAGPPRSQLLWASSANPSGGPLQLAEATEAANELDWTLLARQEQARQAEAAVQARWDKAMLDPLTPPALRRLS
jgi:murein DD-endopeptidase MepM/ murein hydrolase activator NlpD